MILVQPKEAKTNCLSTNLIHPFQPVEDGFAIPALEIRQPSWDFNPYPRGLLIHLTTLMSTPTSKTTILYTCWFLFHLEKLSINLRRPPQYMANRLTSSPHQSKTLMHGLRCLAWCLKARNLDVAHVAQLYQDMCAILRGDSWYFFRGGVVERERFWKSERDRVASVRLMLLVLGCVILCPLLSCHVIVCYILSCFDML